MWTSIFLSLLVSSLALHRYAEPAIDLQQIFSAKEHGWLGADVVCSHPISSNRSLWIFGDTLFGSSDGKTRNITAMYRNSIALLDKDSHNPYFFFQNRNKSPFFKPNAPNSWVWPISLYSSHSHTISVLSYAVVEDPSDPFGFAVNGSYIHVASDLESHPHHWKIQSQFLPFTSTSLTASAAALFLTTLFMS
ncbi:hypothetical protein GEMRC1_005669 [Eukaryota sp. GEM-RC1]